MIRRLIKKYSLLLSIFTIVIAIAFLPGCGKKKDTQKKKAAKKKRAMAKASSIDNLDKPQILNYQFVAEGMRDPFKPFIKKRKKQVATEGETPSGRPRTLLETYDLSSLELTGIIVSTSDSLKNTALIEDVAGRGFIVRVGTFIGKNEGIITSIDTNTLVITEKHLDEILEEIYNKEIKLTLEEKEGE